MKKIIEDKSLPQSVGGELLSPPYLAPEQEDLCKRLDDLYKIYGLKVKPSNMLCGAVFAARTECRSNPDWIAQAANSLREVLYPFWSRHGESVTDRKTEVFKKYGSVLVDDDFIQEIGRMYGLLNNLTHHGNTSKNIDFAKFTAIDFEKLIMDFERIMRNALTRQLDIHREIDKILSRGPIQIATEDTTS